MLVACTGGGNNVPPVSFDSLATVPETTAGSTATADSTTTAAPSTSVEPPAVTEPTAPPTIPGPTGPSFSDSLGVKVDTAPGINTPGDTRQLLAEGLNVHVAWEPDPNDFSVFVPLPEDMPILEAYANGSLAYYSAFLTTLTTDAAEFASYFVDSGSKYDDSFAKAREQGLIGSLGSGVTLRPYVLSDQRTETTAVVLDCILEDQQWVAGDDVAPSALETGGAVATMSRVDGVWKIDQITGEALACT